MQPPRTLDDLLDDARAFPDPGPEEDDEEWASRRRLAVAYAAGVRRGTSGGGFPQPALGPASPSTAGPGRGTEAVPRRETAARELRALSAWAVRGPRAAEHISSLATSHQIDPDSALVFACLLHLADRDDQAEFLWQFSAGAGKTASAECLCLLHTSRGELRQAGHWARQAADLDTTDDEETAPARAPRARTHRELKPLTTLMLLRVWRALRRSEPGSLTISAFHSRAGTLSRTMTRAVHNLKAEPGSEVGSEIGLLSWPDHTLARQMQQCLAH